MGVMSCLFFTSSTQYGHLVMSLFMNLYTGGPASFTQKIAVACFV